MLVNIKSYETTLTGDYLHHRMPMVGHENLKEHCFVINNQKNRHKNTSNHDKSLEHTSINIITSIHFIGVYLSNIYLTHEIEEHYNNKY